jgi:flagellar hook assembly protein FlgD
VRIPVLVSDSPAGVRLDVLDSGGRRVRHFDLSTLAPGASEVVWDGRNDAGRLVAPGVYSAFLVGDGLAQVVRMVRVP